MRAGSWLALGLVVVAACGKSTARIGGGVDRGCAGSECDAGGPSDGGQDDGGGLLDGGQVDGGGATTAFTFLVYGDTRSGKDSETGGRCGGNERHRRFVNLMAQEPNAALVFNTGDFVDGLTDTTCLVVDGSCTSPGAEGNLKAIIAPLNERAPTPGLPAFYFPVMGNHDEPNWDGENGCGSATRDVFCSVFDLTALLNHPTPNDDPCGLDFPDSTYFSVRHGNAVFIVLRVDVDDYDLAADTAQYDWLVAELERASGDPAVEHKFLFLHAPVYTSYGDHSDVLCAPLLMQLCDDYGVDMVFTGHNHTYERTVPIRGGARADGGTVYLTSGGAGVGGYGYSNPGRELTANKAEIFHYVRMRVDGPAVSGEVVDIDGNVFDTF